MTFRSAIFSLLLASVFNVPLNAQTTGQIAGRVVRADTGIPVAGAVITAEPTKWNPNYDQREDRVAKTAADGSYAIRDLSSGDYRVIAYHVGFIGALYPFAMVPEGQLKPLHLAAGQSFKDIDFRLEPAPKVIAMNDHLLSKMYPGLGRLEMGFGPARFSPDGRYLALIITANVRMDDLWRYDTSTQELVALGDGAVEVAWDGDRLYALLSNPEFMNSYSVVEATATGLKRPPQVPLAVQSIFTRWEQGEPPTVLKVEQNSRYVVSSDNPCHGCVPEIKVRRKGSNRERNIAKEQKGFVFLGGFLFDRQRSVVIYPEIAFTSILVASSLDTGDTGILPLPTPYVASLLDGRAEPDGYEIAFVSAGSCLPELTSDGQNPWILPNNIEYRREHSFPKNVCLVTVPER
jgi:hypothetical protein